MSFFVLKLVFAALALGLLVIFFLIVRQIRRKRHERPLAPASDAANEARKPRLAKKHAEANAELPAADPPPARRRQLQSFVETERIAAAEAQPDLPMMPVAEEAEAEAEVEIETQPAPEPLAPEDDPVAAEVTYDQAVLEWLEVAFDALQAGELTLEGYRAQLVAERAAVEERIAALEPAGDGPDLEAALTARDSVQWCIDWAADQAGAR